MSRLRVVNLGLPKSGTTTLGKALARAGLSVADWKVHEGQSRGDALKDEFVGTILYRGYYGTGDPLAEMDEFDAFTEISTISKGLSIWPQFDYPLLSAIEKHHSGAKFILSARPAKDVVDSMMRWSNLGSRRLPNRSVPGLPVGFGTTTDELERWVNGHYEFVRKAFGGQQNFLEYRTDDPEAPKIIGDFLGIELPWWGRSNENKNSASEGAVKGKDE